MPHETRPYQLQPNDAVMRQCRGGRLLNRRVRVTLDPRAFDYDDANDLRVEGIYAACSSNGPTLMLDRGEPMLWTVPLIDVLVIEALSTSDR